MSTDVIVVGGGIVGVACARALAVSGARVTLLRHPSPRYEGWRAAAGMLAAQVEASAGEEVFELAISGRAFYRRHAEALRESTGIDIRLQERGILQIVSTEAGVEAAKAKVAWQRQRTFRADWLDHDEVTDHFPGINPGLGAFWAAEDGQVHPHYTHDALLADAIRRGVRVLDEVVTGLMHQGNKLSGVACLGGSYHAAHVVIANGAWASQLSHLPRPIAVAPVYGRVAVFSWPAALPEAIVFGERCYLLPRDGELLVGATMEHPGFDPQDDPLVMQQLLARAAKIYPPLAAMTPDRTMSGFRPGTPDGIPIIGPEPRLPGLWYATGHGRNGILMAGITGELIAQGIAGEEWSEGLKAAAPDRFWNWAQS